MISSAALAARIHALDALLPDHVIAADSDETDGAVVDQFGRVLPLAADVVVGRDPALGLAVLAASVSKRHARVTYDVDHDRWTVEDLGSRNGTFIEGERVSVPRVLGDGQQISFGDVGFVFVVDRATLASARPDIVGTAASMRRVGTLRLSRPTDEGAGLASHGDASTSLGSTQFQLLRQLAERALASTGESPELRGFVRSVELIANLPWNTPHPEDNHLKQQVRRVRRALERIGFPNAIESRQGFGYRLRVPVALD